MYKIQNVVSKPNPIDSDFLWLDHVITSSHMLQFDSEFHVHVLNDLISRSK